MLLSNQEFESQYASKHILFYQLYLLSNIVTQIHRQDLYPCETSCTRVTIPIIVRCILDRRRAESPILQIQTPMVQPDRFTPVIYSALQKRHPRISIIRSWM